MITIFSLALALVACLRQGSFYDQVAKRRGLPRDAQRIVVCATLRAENDCVDDAAVAISPLVANLQVFSIRAPCHLAPLVHRCLRDHVRTDLVPVNTGGAKKQAASLPSDGDLA